jgi:hypothetical protein
MIKVANIIQSLCYQYFICKFINHQLSRNIDQLWVSKIYFKNGIASNFQYVLLNYFLLGFENSRALKCNEINSKVQSPMGEVFKKCANAKGCLGLELKTSIFV